MLIETIKTKCVDVFLTLTEGRPMIFVTGLFTDCVSGERVCLWKDRKNGDLWMATHKWSRFRVEYPKETEYDELRD